MRLRRVVGVVLFAVFLAKLSLAIQPGILSTVQVKRSEPVRCGNPKTVPFIVGEC